jgi:hypothetical protein
MAASPIRELYVSPNGDRWVLGIDRAGKLVVRHHPNKPSGGLPSEIGVDVFLSRGGGGPEHQALADALADNMEMCGKESEDKILAADTIQKLDRALGQAVAQCWSVLTPEIQHSLFEAAVASEGESIREQLAIHLHSKHKRTVETLQARAIPEPDSLGG